MRKLVVIAGPSCAGKTPLYKALRRFYPDLCQPLTEPVFFNSREPRPSEEDGVDYHFRQRAEIEKFRADSGYLLMDVRGDLQALRWSDLHNIPDDKDAFFEGNPFVGEALLEAAKERKIDSTSIFISPLSLAEIKNLQDPELHMSVSEVIADVMRRKLLRRTKKQKADLSLPDLKNIETRCCSAYNELKLAHKFDWVVPNHDGEDSENWDAFAYLLGDARKTLIAVVKLLSGSQTDLAERWPSNVFHEES